MLAKQPFERRILIAFVLMTAVVSGLFSLTIVVVVHFIEERLVSDEMNRKLHQVLRDDLKQGLPPRLDTSTYFFAFDMAEYAIPQQFSTLKEGFTEIVDGSEAFYAYVQGVDGKTYMLLQEQEFEAHEAVLFNVVLAGFLFTVLASWGLGMAMSRKVMAPITLLAQQVSHQDQLHPLAPPLAPEYPADEIGQLAGAFDCTLSQIRQSLERERLFTSDVSHELRTPLMVIATSCELLAERSLDQRGRDQVERISRASEEMRMLVQTFLQLARDKTNESDFVASQSLSTIAGEQIIHWKPLFDEKGLEFQVRIEALDNSLYNPTLLRTVMANLLRNALHYTDQGFVHLVLESGGFRVEDSGVGIPTEQHDQIFQPFIRGTVTRGEGLGLGLSLVKRICARQGWAISLQQKIEGGSCFKVSLINLN